LALRDKTVPDLPLWGKLILLYGISHKNTYDGLKSVLGIWIPIRWDPDLFDQIRILERAMSVHGLIFQKENEFANLILDLLFEYSKVLPQPPSRDTVPLQSDT
jgi:hypothetical protein